MQAEIKLDFFSPPDSEPERDERFIKVLPLGRGKRWSEAGRACFNFTGKLYYLVYNIQNHWRMEL